MKAYFFLGLLIAAPSFACSPMPLEMRSDFFNDAASQVLSKATVRISDVKITSTVFKNEAVVKYDWVKTDPAFMCHDRETIKTDVEITYDINGGKTGCHLLGTVTKVEAFYVDAPKTTYTIENFQKECE